MCEKHNGSQRLINHPRHVRHRGNRRFLDIRENKHVEQWHIAEQIWLQTGAQPTIHSRVDRVPLSSFFFKFLSIILIFPQVFLIFVLILVFRVGDSYTKEGLDYATDSRPDISTTQYNTWQMLQTPPLRRAKWVGILTCIPS